MNKGHHGLVDPSDVARAQKAEELDPFAQAPRQHLPALPSKPSKDGVCGNSVRKPVSSFDKDVRQPSKD
jgi:hypothetical protein